MHELRLCLVPCQPPVIPPETVLFMLWHSSKQVISCLLPPDMCHQILSLCHQFNIHSSAFFELIIYTRTFNHCHAKIGKTSGYACGLGYSRTCEAYTTYILVNFRSLRYTQVLQNSYHDQMVAEVTLCYSYKISPELLKAIYSAYFLQLGMDNYCIKTHHNTTNLNNKIIMIVANRQILEIPHPM